MLDLAGKPFWLDRDGISWVRQTLAGMSLSDKIGQLFCLLGRTTNTSDIGEALEIVRPGGYMFRPAAGAAIRECHAYLQDHSNIPLLLSANLETGGIGIALDGTQFASPMQVAATDDETQAYRLGLVCGREGRAVGCNWTFSPTIDLDLNVQNPITNTRTFGSDRQRVGRMALAYMKGVQECGLGVTVKHWPGDGVDGRDQHLLTTVNTLSVKEWEQGFGTLYANLIAGGVNAVMSAHIMLPAYSRTLLGDVADESLLPASLARELNCDLLRGFLGFNGVVITDATNMAGFTMLMPRELAVPSAIAAGNDMFLFTINLAEDVQFMRAGVERGIISHDRLDEAVTRILALKASLRLPQRRRDGALVPDASALSVLNCSEHRCWAAECADRSVTLVKDTQNLLPITPHKHKKILVFVIGDRGGYLDYNGGMAGAKFVRSLAAEGFEVTRHDYSQVDQRRLGELATMPVGEIKRRYDLVIYLASVKTASNQSTVRLTWAQPMGYDCPKFISDIPTLFVSIDNPYHLQDVPRMRTFINAYANNEQVIDAVVEKLVGKSPFKGVSPIDPFCGYWDTRL